MSDLNTHPLSEFFRLVAAEFDDSVKVYGAWAGKSSEWQFNAVKGECLEWEAANMKSRTTGKYDRELGELPQMANVAGKRWLRIKSNMP